MTTESRVSPTVRSRVRKFDLDADRPLPRLEGTGPIATQHGPDRAVLSDTYFDTEDHRLLRAGVTLRKRTGGVDAGWDLEVPDGDEVHLPLEAGETGIPAELADRLKVDAAGLIEVAHIRTERHRYDLADHANQRLATVTDDHVTAELAGSVAHLDGWREAEIGLGLGAEPGLLDALADALTGAGARPAHWPSKLRRLLAEDLPARIAVDKRSTAGDVVMAYVTAQVEALRQHDLGVRRNEDDAVHQLRVAMRRLRTALTMFRRVLDRERTKQVADELKWAGGVLSRDRSTEVLRSLLTEELATLGDSATVGKARAALTQYFDQAAAQARAAALGMLNDRRYAALLGSLETLIDEPPLTVRADWPARRELQRAIDRAHRRLRRAVDGIADAADEPAMDDALHEVRKKAKQARYVADTVRPAFGKRLRPWRKSAKAVQTTLGDYHDLVEARALLERLSVADGVPAQVPFVLGRLYERARARGAAMHERFTEQWEHVPTPG
ncbi:MAG TPA: CYTH and CHAD domain-containing protein [Amycolatopsis sp.]|nr:CYTH and CHAD domain-containing protein [Amycolatopsis sp.]